MEYFPTLLIERIDFEFEGCWVVNFNFIQILKAHSVIKQCRTWADTILFGIWSGSTLFVDVQ